MTLTAAVAAGATPVSRGQVVFCDAAATYCTDVHILGLAQLTSAGTATLNFRPGIGSHSYKAMFLGTKAYTGSSSSAASLTVTGTAGPVASSSSIAETGSWGNYALTATVTEAGKTVGPTGTVSFLDSNNGNAVLGTETLGTAFAGVGWPNPKSLSNVLDTEFVAAADLNGDGIPDLVVESNQIAIYLGNPDGSYTKAATPSFSDPTDRPVLVADFNGDGIPDLAVTMYAGNYISILLGNGDGTFAPVTKVTLPGTIVTVSQLVTGDFNGDGVPDLAAIDSDSSSIDVLLGNGDGSFTLAASNPPVSGALYGLAVGDFNGDGRADLTVSNGGDAIAILLSKGDGTFTAGSTAHSGVNNSPIAVADFNGDGKLDLAVAAGGVGGSPESVTVLTGNGDGTFNAPSSGNVASTYVSYIAVADFNQDGTADVVLGDQGGNATVLLNNGSGSFSRSFPVVSGLSVPYYLMTGVADVNGDGYPDIVVGGYYNNTLALYLTQPTETATASAGISLPAGLHQTEASYSGDTKFNSSLSAALALWGTPPATTTTLTLSAGGNPVISVAAGTVVTLASTVTAGGAPVTAGQVNFCDAAASHCTDIHVIGTAALSSNGTAVYKFVPGPGTHSYKAEFVQNGLGAQSSSSAVSVTVGSMATVYSETTSISGTGSPGNYTLTGTVIGYGGSLAPTGEVSFLDTSNANASLGSAQLGSSTAGTGWLVSQSPALGGSNPAAEVTADFNGDGIPDIAVLSSNSSYGGPYSLTMFTGRGDGTFTAGASVALPGLVNQTNLRMIAGDFNGDGKPDVSILSELVGNNVSSVTTLLSNGDGTFGAGQTSVAYSQGLLGGDVLGGSMVAADFNGDGKLDLAVAGDCENACGVTILIGNGDGTFGASSSPYAPTQAANVIATGDFNGDGIADLVAANYFAPGGAAILLGKGDGTFSAPTRQISLSTFARAVVVGDFNGDGLLDLAFGFDGAIEIYLGNGDGTFTQGQQVSGSGMSLISGDFNHDGKLDLASINNAQSDVALFLGNGDGTFTVMNTSPSSLPSSNLGTTSIVTADFNADGVPDLALSVPTFQNLSILLNEPTETATAPITGVAPTGPGTHNVEASYAGDGNYAAGTSSTIPLAAALAPLVVTPASGGYQTAQTITITESIPGATIYYAASGIVTTNGFVPYTGPITLNEGGTESIQAYASETGYLQTNTQSYSYTINLPLAPKPVFSPAAGSYSGTQKVSISEAANGATIFYTTDGSAPTSGSAVYTGPIAVSASQTLVAMAIAPGYSMSAPSAAQYLIDSTATSLIYTFAGNGTAGYSGDGGPATLADLNNPGQVVEDSAGNIYFSDQGNSVVRRVAAGTGIITTVAGTGLPGYSGDGGAATSAQLNSPGALAIDSAGNLYIADVGNLVIRKLTAGTGILTTYAGNGSSSVSGDGGQATSAAIGWVTALTIDGSGNLYLAESSAYTIRMISAGTGIITTIAGNGSWGYSGDGGPALNASIGICYGLALDAAGDLYISDFYNNVVREVKKASGNISTVAGSKTQGSFSGDGGSATSATLNSPEGIAVDSAGNLYIADYSNQRIRKVAFATGQISTIAGNGSSCSSIQGDGGPSGSESLCYPYGIAVDQSGNLYVSDYTSRIRFITSPGNPPAKVAASPMFSVAAGTYPNTQIVTLSDTTPGAEIYVTMDGTTATTAGQGYNGPITVDGNVVIGAVAVAPGFQTSAPVSANYTITAGPARIIVSRAGNGTQGFSGQGGPALQAELGYPSGVAISPTGDLYISDEYNFVVWKVAANTGTISVYAGSGTYGALGDGGPATAAQLLGPEGLALDKAGNLYIADTYDNRVREVAAGTGIITTVAGSGSFGNSGDGGPATQALLTYPSALAVDASGDLYIANSGYGVVRKVTMATGIITTVAGNGQIGAPTGDGGPATSATLGSPISLAFDSSGDLFIGTQGTGEVRKVAAGTGIISTIAGNGNRTGASGDGGPALKAEVNPQSLAVDSSGNLYIGNPPTIRRVDAKTGVISRFAGNGYGGAGGDGGSVTVAGLCSPAQIAMDASDNLYVADGCNFRLREIMLPGAAAAPTIGLASGTYTGPQSVSITDSSPNATIYYTVDGTTPTKSSTPYSGPITVSSSETLKAIAVAPGFTVSTAASATYTITAGVAPVITWSTPSPIVYGTALSATQLDATASVPGTFTYSPGLGAVLKAGQQTITATFTPTDIAEYTTAQKSVTLVVNQATPTVTWPTPAAINFGTALSATQLDATASVSGTFAYSPAAGAVPPTGTDTLSVTFTPTDTADYTTATASVSLVVNPFNTAPVLNFLKPAIATAGGSAFTLTIGGSGFQTSSVAYWGSTALVTQYVSATQITAQVPAAELASSGTSSITVQTPAPGGGASSAMQFEVDSASGPTPPSFTTSSVTVTAGSTATYAVTLPSTATSVSVQCLNLPPGATCTYSASSGAVSIATSSTTPKGTYQITIVFNETLPGAAAAGLFLPILIVPILYFRKRFTRAGWLATVLVIGVVVGTLSLSGCGGGSSTSTPPPTQQTHVATSSGAVTLTVQ